MAMIVVTAVFICYRNDLHVYSHKLQLLITVSYQGRTILIENKYFHYNIILKNSYS